MAKEVGLAVEAVPTTGGGTIDLIDTSFQGVTPNAAMFFLTLDTAPINDVATAQARFSVGATDGTRQWSVAIYSTDAAGTTQSGRTIDTAQCIERHSSAGVVARLSFNSWITNGVRLDVDAGESSDGVWVTAVLFNAANAYASTQALSTQDTEVNITAPGFGDVTDKTLVFCAGDGGVAGDAVHAIFSFGVAANLTAGVSQAGLGFYSVSSVSTSVTGGKLVTDGATMQVFNDALTWTGEISNFDSSGFSCTARDGASSGDLLCYLLLEFESDVWVGQQDTPTSTGNSDLTAMGWPAAFVLEGMSFHDTVDSLETTGLGSAFGVSLYTPEHQYSLCMADEDGQAPTDTESLMDNQLRFHQDDGTLAHAAQYVQNLSNGVRRNFTTTDATARKWFGCAIRDVKANKSGLQVIEQGISAS